jgi:enterochelin esterase-like enzyme
MNCRPRTFCLAVMLSVTSTHNSSAATDAGRTNLAGAMTNSADAALRNVTIQARVPEGVSTVYLTGNRPEIGDWDPRGFAMTGSGRDRTASLRLPAGTQLEFKFTLGSWDREGLGPSGTVMPNYRLLVDTDTNFTIAIPDFKKGGVDLLQYIADWKGSGVLGRLVYWTNVSSPFLASTRNVEIWLPPGYDDQPTNRYEVLYLHDGQNLFDPRLANTGVDWGVDEAIVRCVNAGKMPPLIVVGVWNTGQRLREYSPWDLGTNYAGFLIKELMPQVNRTFRTRTGPDHTSVMGSSMGGLISFWLCWKHPEVFGRAGCLSSTFPWTGKIPMRGSGDPPLIERDIAANPAVPRHLRFYFDYGTGTMDSMIEPEQNRISAWLRSQGLKEGEDFVVRTFPGAEHNEAAWRARLDEPLTFLFGPRAPGH